MNIVESGVKHHKPIKLTKHKMENLSGFQKKRLYV